MKELNIKLFEAWQSGDEKARNQAWDRLWDALYTTSALFCRRLGMDETTAEDTAKDAFLKTLEQIEEMLQAGKIEWQGSDQFISFVGKRLGNRCHDECRKVWKERNRLDSLDAPIPGNETEHLDLRDTLATGEPTPEEALLQESETRQVDQVLQELRARCRTRQALQKAIDQIESHVRNELTPLLPPRPGVTYTLDDLLLAADREDLRRVRNGISTHIRVQLRIRENALSLRLLQIRRLLVELRRERQDNS